MRGTVESVWSKPGPLAIALTPLAALYSLGWWAYQALYASGIKQATKPHTPILCVGNLVAGGSGKTPAALRLAELLQNQGLPVVVGTSGYGSPRAENATLAPEGPLDIDVWGDESTMLRWLAPDLPLVVGRDRVQAATLVHQNLPDHLLLMDDGFQHLPLAKDYTLVLDPQTPNPFPFPAGPYREPRSTGFRRADQVLTPQDLVRHPLQFLDPATLDPQPVPKTANLLCAIANPHRFTQAVLSAGVQITTQILRPDHDPLAAGTLLNNANKEIPLVVTAKDFVKLRARQDLSQYQIFVAVQKTTFRDEQNLVQNILAKLHDRADRPRHP